MIAETAIAQNHARRLMENLQLWPDFRDDRRNGNPCRPVLALSEKAVSEIFDAKPVFELFRAADQDGYDGGWVLDDGTGERWAEDKETLIKEFYEREKFN